MKEEPIKEKDLVYCNPDRHVYEVLTVSGCGRYAVITNHYGKRSEKRVKTDQLTIQTRR